MVGSNLTSKSNPKAQVKNNYLALIVLDDTTSLLSLIPTPYPNCSLKNKTFNTMSNNSITSIPNSQNTTQIHFN